MSEFLDRLRMWPWLVATLGLAAVVYSFSPQTLEIAPWKAVLLTGAAYLGYLLDRATSPYARPHEVIRQASHAPTEAMRIAWLQVAASAMLRRAIIMAAVIVGAALGV